MKIHSYPELDTWCNSLDHKAAIVIQRVMKILRTECDQYGSNVFITPIKVFREANLDKNTYESILFNLDAHNVIEAVNTRSTHTSKDPNVLSLSVDSIANNIRIIPPLFKYAFDLLKIKTEDGGEVQSVIKPECVVKKGVGFIRYGKSGQLRKIGSVKSVPFRFLEMIINPLGVYKSVDSLFTTIWLDKYNQDSRLTNPTTSQARKVEIITNSAIKELQKNNKLDGKIGFQFNISKTQVKAVLAEQ